MVDENDEFDEDALGTQSRTVSLTYPGKSGDTEG